MVMRPPINPEEPKRSSPAVMVLAVGIAGAILVFATCAGCGFLMNVLEGLQ